MTGKIAHYAAESLIFPFPAGRLAAEEDARCRGIAAHPFKDLGFRSAATEGSGFKLVTDPIA